MKKSGLFLKGVVASLTLLVIGGSVTRAQASSTYRRTKTVKVKSKAYYSTSKTGKAYQFSGPIKRFKFSKPQILSNYADATWTRTAKTTVKMHGKRVLYYRVTSDMDHYQAWVRAKYLKPGRNYQKTKTTAITHRNYVQATKKRGKLYQVFTYGRRIMFDYSGNLHPTITYTATKHCYIYKHGKRYSYYYVKDRLSSVKRWVWAGYLKRGTYVKPDSTYDKQKIIDETITLLNQYRAKENAAASPLIWDANLQSLGDQRAVQLKANFSHYNLDGSDPSAPIAKKLGIYDTYLGTEDIYEGGFDETNHQTAKDIVEAYRSSAPHWYDLMNGSFTKIGVGLYSPQLDLYNAIELGF